jgi:hypothetical protein
VAGNLEGLEQMGTNALAQGRRVGQGDHDSASKSIPPLNSGLRPFYFDSLIAHHLTPLLYNTNESPKGSL